MQKNTYCLSLTVLFAMLIINPVSAQIDENLYRKNYKIDPDKEKEFSVEIDNLSFFKNNEFEGDIVKGYTLPGLWLQGKAVYYPKENIKLEAGFHSLYYHGSRKYPSYAYLDLAEWNPDSYQRGVHLLPFVRAQISLSESFDVVLGNIYGGANHGLIEPLYNPELNMIADPEAGLQFLYSSRVMDFDTWVNWESFIFKTDTHQEAFTGGLSMRFKINNPDSRFHTYAILQGLAQHRGGEINTIYENSVQTFMNGAVGAGLTWNIDHPVFKKANIEVDGLGYYQQAGTMWPLNDGKALYVSASADIANFRLKTGYLSGKNFISMFGTPLFGAVSTVTDGVTYKNNSTMYLGAEYSRSFGEGYSFGIAFDLYNTAATGTVSHSDGVSTNESVSGSSFTMGAFMRINPSLLIKKF
jgi:hypothetical protein